MPRHVYLFSGASAVGKTSALKPASPAGRGRHRSLRLQDRLPEDRGRGALSAHGATLCDGSERGPSARIIFLSPTCRSSGTGRTD